MSKRIHFHVRSPFEKSILRIALICYLVGVLWDLFGEERAAAVQISDVLIVAGSLLILGSFRYFLIHPLFCIDHGKTWQVRINSFSPLSIPKYPDETQFDCGYLHVIFDQKRKRHAFRIDNVDKDDVDHLLHLFAGEKH
ncbi:MAG: hypothetical protein KTR24_08145 [Saprospiraceae bacterium]|nr:hypothetical protein [Saprospiraceae bacterium]